MIVPESTALSGTWRAGDAGPEIEYSLAVLEEIRAQAVAGFHAFGHGGIEVGGVLFGTVENGVIRILGSASLNCEYAFGPGFVLSDQDRTGFAALLKAPPGMEPVGWYVSHTRTDLSLGPNDLEIFDRFYKQAGSIAFVIKPARLGPSGAVFFYRGEDGEIRSGETFAVDTAPQRRAIEPLPGAPDAPPATPDLEGSPPEPQSQIESEPAPVREAATTFAAAEAAPRRSRFRLAWLLAAAVLAIVAAFFLWKPRPPARLQLRAHEISAGQVRIEWDRAGVSALRASSGILEIEDGGSRLRVPLDSEQLRTSSITYAHRSPRIALRLRVQRAGGGPLEEGLTYSGKTPALTANSAPAPPAPAPSERSVESQAKSAPPQAPERVTVEQVAPRNEPIQRASADRDPDAAQKPVPPPRKLAIIPAAPASQTKPATALPSPPAVAARTPGPAAAFPLSARLPAPTPPTARAPAYAGPRSGRLIWAGSLARRGVVEIEGSHASVGSLSGALPGAPVSLRVSPAAFSSEGGLVIYSSDAARNGKSEPASAANGWNGARFEWDPERARDITLLETPNPSNQFKRLALRNDARACSVIIIEWTLQ